MKRVLSRTGARWVFLAALAVHLVYLAALPASFLDSWAVESHLGYGQAADFYGIYQAGANFLHGYSIYDFQDYRAEAPVVVPYSYFYRYLPPTAIIAAGGAEVLPPWPAYWFWVAITEIVLALVVLSLLRGSWTPENIWPSERRYLAAALWVGFFPLFIEQFMGQFSLLMAALLYAMWRAEMKMSNSVAPHTHAAPMPVGWRGYSWHADRPGPWRSVVSWAASVSLKSYPALLAFSFLRDRRIKHIVWSLGIAAIVSLPYFIFRPADLWEFMRLNFNPFTPVLYKGAFGLQTFLADVYSFLPATWLSPGIHLLGRSFTVHRFLMLAPSAVIFLAALWGTWRLRGHPLPERLAFDIAIWTTLLVLVFKNIWEYHYLMLLPAVTAVYLASGRRAAFWFGVILGLPTLYPLAPVFGIDPRADLATWPAWFQILHFGVKALPALAFFIWVLRRAARTRQTQSAF